MKAAMAAAWIRAAVVVTPAPPPGDPGGRNLRIRPSGLEDIGAEGSGRRQGLATLGGVLSLRGLSCHPPVRTALGFASASGVGTPIGAAAAPLLFTPVDRVDLTLGWLAGMNRRSPE
jgi:hypothetical protein